jgi:hypothetical protein
MEPPQVCRLVLCLVFLFSNQPLFFWEGGRGGVHQQECRGDVENYKEPSNLPILTETELA